MYLEKRFEEATYSTTDSINSLILNRPYPIIRAKRLTTTYGLTVLLSLRDANEKIIQVYVPKRYADVMLDEDIENINSQSIYINLVYKGINEFTKAYLLAIDS